MTFTGVDSFLKGSLTKKRNHQGVRSKSCLRRLTGLNPWTGVNCCNFFNKKSKSFIFSDTVLSIQLLGGVNPSHKVSTRRGGLTV